MSSYRCITPSCAGQLLSKVTDKNIYLCICCGKEYPIDASGKPVWQGSKKKKRPKYNNNRVKIDGIWFDSELEGDYYCLLKLQLKAGEIAGMTPHPEFLLTPETEDEEKSVYEPDFIVFYNDGTAEVIDTKGVRTGKYIQKIKSFKMLYPKIRFREVRREEVPR